MAEAMDRVLARASGAGATVRPATCEPFGTDAGLAASGGGGGKLPMGSDSKSTGRNVGGLGAGASSAEHNALQPTRAAPSMLGMMPRVCIVTASPSRQRAPLDLGGSAASIGPSRDR